ncbi:MAG: ABC transporter ATP-binding protein [Deltaproteobacteria bacterium]|nr:ABC transporter ATP-binding protein [Deltaproteobacteria bacterium]
MGAKIRIEGLTKVFHGGAEPVVALSEVSLEVPEGQFFCVLGPSGCGKTTLLRIVAGLERPGAGRVVVTHADPTKPVNAMIFQEQSIFPWMTVRQNIGYGLRLRGVSREEREAVVEHHLRKIGLLRFADAYPHQLSGGMKQRVSVARAFANDPEILLMDEPFAALDEQNKILLQEELLRIWEETRKTVLFITHSIDEALILGDRVMLMTAHPGRIKAVVEVEFPRPRGVYEIKSTPAFGALAYQIWKLLRDEVLRAKEECLA